MAAALKNATQKVTAFVGQLKVSAKPRWDEFMKYAKVELAPPTSSDLPALREDIARLIDGARKGAYKEVTVREAWLNTLVTVEVICWFFIGECIGKRHLVGYKV